MNKMNTRCLGRQNSKTYLISFTFIEAVDEVTEIIPVMTALQDIVDMGHMLEIEEGVLHSEADSEVTIIEEDHTHTEDKTAIEMKVTVDSRDLEVNPELQLEDLELHQGLPAEIKIDFSVADSLVILAKNDLKRTYLKIKCSIESKNTSLQRCPHFYEGDSLKKKKKKKNYGSKVSWW